MSLFPDYTPTPEKKKPAGQFHNRPETRQKMLLSGLDCLPGQRDLFDVDGAGKDIRMSDHADGAHCCVTFGGETVRFLIYRRPGETYEETRARGAKKAAEHLAELQAIAAERT